MSRSKRVRVIWAALTQEWQEKQCVCGFVIWHQKQSFSALIPELCESCEIKTFEAWMAQKERA